MPNTPHSSRNLSVEESLKEISPRPRAFSLPPYSSNIERRMPGQPVMLAFVELIKSAGARQARRRARLVQNGSGGAILGPTKGEDELNERNAMKGFKRSRKSETSADKKSLRRFFPMTILTLIVLLLVSTLYMKCNQWMTATGPFLRTYEGRIEDKSATFAETELGSGVRFRLVVRTKSGQQLQVATDQKTYESAQVGMWIKSSETGIQLSWAEGEQGPPALEKGK
jgi:hypothetical protein